MLIKYFIGLMAFIGLLAKSYPSGKSSVTNTNNEKVAKDVENLNKVKTEVSHLSDSDLDKQLPQWSRTNQK